MVAGHNGEPRAGDRGGSHQCPGTPADGLAKPVRYHPPTATLPVRRNFFWE